MDLISFYSTVLVLFAVLIVGFVCSKAGIINESASKTLSAVTLKICQPCMIIGAMIKTEYSAEKLKTGLLVLALTLVSHGLFIVIAHLFTCKIKEIDEQKICKFGIVFANCGFIGLPIVESLLGTDGAFYAGYYLFGFNLLFWTYGVYLFIKDRKEEKLSVKKVFLNFGTIACAIGFLMFVSPFSYPAFIVSSIQTLGNMCTPLSLLVVGALISRAELGEFFKNSKLYLVCSVKLLLLPILTFLICLLCKLDTQLTVFFTIMASMPTACGTVMFSELYDVKPKETAIITGACNLLSLGTIPLLLTVIEKII